MVTTFEDVRKDRYLSFFFSRCTADNRQFTTLLILFLLVVSCTSNPGSNPVESGTSETGAVIAPPSFPTLATEADSLSITGTLVCAHCYALDDQNVGVNHILPESGFIEACAMQCANLGYPVAVLINQDSKDAKIWVIRTSSSLFADYMGQQAEVKGSLVSDGIIEPSGILVASGPGKWDILL